MLFFPPTQKLTTTTTATLRDFDRQPAVGITVTRELPLRAYALGLLNDESTRYDNVYARTVGSSSFGALGQARAAYYRGLPGKGEVLLQVASGAGTGFQWGDASSIFFLIKAAVLQERDFSKVVVVNDEC